MNTRRFFAAAAFALMSAACAGGSGPTFADEHPDDGALVLPDAPPTDTSVFVPAP